MRLYSLREVPKIVTDWYSICCGRRRYHTAINDEGNSEDSSNDGNEDNDSDIDSLFSKSHSHAGNKKDNRPCYSWFQDTQEAIQQVRV